RIECLVAGEEGAEEACSEAGEEGRRGGCSEAGEEERLKSGGQRRLTAKNDRSLEERSRWRWWPVIVAGGADCARERRSKADPNIWVLIFLMSGLLPPALLLPLHLSHLDEEKILNVVNPEKDVDGFHPLNMGCLAMKGREPFFVPCAAKSCIDLLLRFGIEIVGKNAVVVGRSKLVGLPVSLLLQRHHATVSVVHSFTKNPQELTREADIIITDVGVPNMIRGDWLKPGTVVIDAGTNAVKDPSRKHGFHLSGDVCFEEAVRVASVITPVPGGLGPITISMLLSNTLDSAKRAYGFV
ncbi:hypothetical protein SOVF_193670, partial [Spinacia oleracea]